MPARLCLLLLLLAIGARPCAAAWPDKPIQMIVPFPAGGPADVVAHILAPRLARRLGQKVVVDNREGRDGITGSAIVAAAPADGYTLLLTPSAHVLHPATYKSLPFDTERAFAPISLLLQSQYVLVVNPAIPADSVKGLIDYAKSHAEPLRYASAGPGGPSQLTFALFAIASGTNFVHVAYSGGGPALQAVVDNQAQTMMAPLVTAVPAIQEDKLNALGVSGKHPTPALPDVPTIAETLPGFAAYSWLGVMAPTGTPKAIIKRLSELCDEIIHDKEVSAGLAIIGAEPVGGPPGLLAALIEEEIPKWRKVAKEAGILVE